MSTMLLAILISRPVLLTTVHGAQMGMQISKNYQYAKQN